MDLKYTYYYFTSAISAEWCDKIKSYGLQKIRFLKEHNINPEATTKGNTHKQALKNSKPMLNNTVEELAIKNNKTPEEIIKNNYIRDSEVCWFDDQWIYDLVYPYLHKANENAGWRYDFDYSESFQFTVYRPGGFYGWHSDSVSDHFGKYVKNTKDNKNLDDNISYTDNDNFVGKIRKLSMTINLNAPGEYEGGNLKFDLGPHSQGERFVECKEIRPQGSIIVFPSFVNHQVTPITKGTRYSLVLWSLGYPFR